jgi:hypothetical protein
MKKLRIVADTLSTAYGEDPKWTAIIASSKDETVEVLFETMKTPLAVSSLVQSSQDALRKMDVTDVAEISGEIAWHLESAMQILPDAIGFKLTADGNVLCRNIGTGAICFKLTEAAKDELKNL